MVSLDTVHSHSVRVLSSTLALWPLPTLNPYYNTQSSIFYATLCVSYLNSLNRKHKDWDMEWKQSKIQEQRHLYQVSAFFAILILIQTISAQICMQMY